VLGERRESDTQGEEVLNQTGAGLGILYTSCYYLRKTQETATVVNFKWWRFRAESEFRHLRSYKKYPARETVSTMSIRNQGGM